MLRDFDDCDEAAIYERILQSWQKADMREEDADKWLAKFVIDVLAEDRRRGRPKKTTIARIISNCLILVLALASKKPVDLRGDLDVSELSPDQQKQVFRDLATIAME